MRELKVAGGTGLRKGFTNLLKHIELQAFQVQSSLSRTPKPMKEHAVHHEQDERVPGEDMQLRLTRVDGLEGEAIKVLDSLCQDIVGLQAAWGRSSGLKAGLGIFLTAHEAARGSRQNSANGVALGLNGLVAFVAF